MHEYISTRLYFTLQMNLLDLTKSQFASDPQFRLNHQ